MKLLGIDDAGRGPALGPMILAGILIEQKEEEKLRQLKVKDSKLLTPTQRKKIGDILKTKYKHHIEISTPKEIDDSTNLNYLEAKKVAKIINTLTKNLNEKVKVIIDCPSVNIQSWTNDVKKLLTDNQQPSNKANYQPKADYQRSGLSAKGELSAKRPLSEVPYLVCEHKADANHPIVSAASILAKEKREDEIYKLKLALKTDFGSGYPSDPKTKKFVTENFNNPKYKNLIRHSWNTIKKLHKPRQKTLF